MLKVLVAEDEPWIRAAIVEMVESIGHDIKVVGDVTNGVEAWHMIHNESQTELNRIGRLMFSMNEANNNRCN